MTPYELDQLRQEPIEQQAAIALDRYTDGAVDAAFGELPQSADDDYLAGYINTIKQLPRDKAGRVIHASAPPPIACTPTDRFDACSWGEF